MKFILILILLFTSLASCQTVSNKIDKKVSEEEKQLSSWLNRSEEELKIEFGKPDSVELLNNKNKILIYYESKFKIKCERRFEVDQKNIVVAFNSKNCF